MLELGNSCPRLNSLVRIHILFSSVQHFQLSKILCECIYVKAKGKV